MRRHKEIYSYQRDSPIFNLDFEPNGRRLTVLTEGGEVVLTDPSVKAASSELRGHDSCVNVASWIGEHEIATGSDDCTVRIFDVRTERELRVLHGHNNWVKNVEHVGGGTIVSSSFDGTVRMWDPHRAYPRTSSPPDNIIMEEDSLSRMKITNRPDGSMLMVISTLYGRLMLVHNLDLKRASEGELMGVTAMGIEAAMQRKTPEGDRAMVPTVAFRKTNRVELVREGGVGCSTSLAVSPCKSMLLTRRLELSKHALGRLWGRAPILDLAQLATREEVTCVFDLDMQQERLQQGATEAREWLETPDAAARWEAGRFGHPRAHRWTLPPPLAQWPDALLGGLPFSVEEEGEEGNGTFRPGGVFPDRLLMSVEDSAAAKNHIKGSCFLPCGRFVASPYHKGLRILDVEGAREWRRRGGAGAAGGGGAEEPGALVRRREGAVGGAPLAAHQVLVNTHKKAALTAAAHPHLPIIYSGGLDGAVKAYGPQM